MAGGDGEEVGDELAEVGNGDAFAHGWVGDDEVDRAWIEVAEVGDDELSLDHWEIGSGEILFGGVQSFSAEVGADDFGNVAEEGAFDEFETRPAEGVPDYLGLVRTLALRF